MTYFVGIQMPNSQPHPGFPFKTFEDAKTAVHVAINNGFFCRDDKVHLMTGPGTVYKIVHESVMGRQEPEIHEKGHVLIIQMQQGVMTGSPELRNMLMQVVLSFESEEALKEVVNDALVMKGDCVITHVAKGGNETTYVHLDTGMVLMQMSAEEFMKKQREALLMQMRSTGRSPSGVVIPGKG